MTLYFSITKTIIAVWAVLLVPNCQGLSACPRPPSSDQLTLEGLQEILQKLIAGGTSRESILAYRIPSLDKLLSRTRIGPSRMSNAGRGLFAAVECRRGDLLTCYPGDVLVHTHSNPKSNDADIFEWGSHVPAALYLDDDTFQSTILTAYSLEVSDAYAILGLPSLDNNLAYAGHFANDGARPPKSDSQIAAYVLESNERANAMHVPCLEDCHMVTVATRDIQQGEEILVTYGPDYWKEYSCIGWGNVGMESGGGYSETPASGKGFG